ncbi:MAG TPA: hypothetical protein VKY37_09310 [Brumimicrobium sp.]|nr:hypothetical protein [Brumimicrobium sp.]
MMECKCSYCDLPKGDLNYKDYFEKIALWRQYVNEGIFKFIGGDTALETLEEEVFKEEKYVYYHFFECTCGSFLRTGICIRSSIPILEHIKSLPSELATRRN